MTTLQLPCHIQGALWNDPGHKSIITAAFETLQTLRGPDGASLIQPLYDLFGGENSTVWTNFRSQLDAGLADADIAKEPSCGGTYFCHFYDPENGLNLSDKYSFPNALEQCVRYAKNAFQLRGSAGDAGWNLGVALHFLSDVTQPLHAANVGNFISRGSLLNPVDIRHKKFEDGADPRISQFAIPATSLERRTTLGDLAHSAAVNAKRIWLKTMKPIMDRINREGTQGGNWSAVDLDAILRESVPPAVRWVATFLRDWASNPAKIGGPQLYKICSAANQNLVIEALPKERLRLGISDPSNPPRQLWSILESVPSTTGWYIGSAVAVQNPNAKFWRYYGMDVEGNVSRYPKPIVSWERSGQSNQIFQQEVQKDGTWVFGTVHNPEFVIEIDGNIAVGSTIRQGPRKYRNLPEHLHEPHQQWHLRAV